MWACQDHWEELVALKQHLMELLEQQLDTQGCLAEVAPMLPQAWPPALALQNPWILPASPQQHTGADVAASAGCTCPWALPCPQTCRGTITTLGNPTPPSPVHMDSGMD